MEKQFKEIIARYCSQEADSITDDMNIRNDLGLSSLDLMTFLGDLEDEFNVEFDFDEEGSRLAGITTVGDAIGLLKQYMD